MSWANVNNFLNITQAVLISYMVMAFILLVYAMFPDCIHTVYIVVCCRASLRCSGASLALCLFHQRCGLMSSSVTLASWTLVKLIKTSHHSLSRQLLLATLSLLLFGARCLPWHAVTTTLYSRDLGTSFS